MVELTNITFSFKPKVKLFEALEFSIEKGKIYGLFGENGAGKSTLLKIICGMLFPQKGEVLLEGVSIQKRASSSLAKLFYLPEDYQLPDLSIQKFLDVTAPFYPNFEMEKAHYILENFNLDAKNQLNKMSYGQKKKALIALALATNADLLLMDEPTNGLDIPSKSVFRKSVVASLNDHQSLVISTHQVRDLEALIDPIVVLSNGKVIFNQAVDRCMEKLRFEKHSQIEDLPNLIYAEEVLGGYECIIANASKREQKPNIELLFNALHQKPEAFHRIFK